MGIIIFIAGLVAGGVLGAFALTVEIASGMDRNIED